MELFVFNFTKFVTLENLSILDLALSGVKVVKFIVEFIYQVFTLHRILQTVLKTKNSDNG